MACPPIVKRADWNADQVSPSVNMTNLNLPVYQVVLLHTVSIASCNTLDLCKKEVKRIQKFHMIDNGWADIGYNFLIGGEGSIFEGRGWNLQGAFYKGQNNISYGIAFMGSFGPFSNDRPSSAALNSSVRLVNCALSLKYLNKDSLKYTHYTVNPEVLQDFRKHPDAPIEATTSTSVPSTTHTINGSDTTYTSSKSTPSDIPVIPVALAASGALLLLILFFALFWWKRRHRKKIIYSQICNRLPVHVLNQYRISRKDVVIRNGKDCHLGSGNFGIVVKGWLKNYPITGTAVNSDGEVAVKLHRDKVAERTVDKSGLDTFLLEMEMLMKIGRHVNIVNLIGVVLEEVPMIVMEYCSLGSLETFLKNPENVSLITGHADGPDVLRLEERYVIHSDSVYRDRTTAHALTSVNDLISFGFQISRGMEFVSARNIIHRDLAARNILLDRHRTAKIGDFGMAREEIVYILERENVELPLRWLAIESILPQNESNATRRGSYTTKTDVWSFGVTLWEIFTLCRSLPYKEEFPNGLNWEMLVGFLSSNERLAQPAYCPAKMYDIMKKCWAADPQDRWTFAEMRDQLSSLLPKEMQHDYLVLDEKNYVFNQLLDKHYENWSHL